MKKLLFSGIILIAAFFQATFLNSFKIFGIKPDLLLIGVAIASIYFEMKWALVIALFAGMLKDLFGIQVIGINTMLFPLWGFCVIRLTKKIHLDNIIVLAVVVFAASIFNSLLTRLIFFWMGRSISAGFFLRIIFLEALYTVALLPPAFKLCKYLIKPTGIEWQG